MPPPPAGAARARVVPLPRAPPSVGTRFHPPSTLLPPPPPRAAFASPALPGDFFTSAALPAPASGRPSAGRKLSDLWSSARPAAGTSRRDELRRGTFFRPTFDDEGWRTAGSSRASTAQQSADHAALGGRLEFNRNQAALAGPNGHPWRTGALEGRPSTGSPTPLSQTRFSPSPTSSSPSVSSPDSEPNGDGAPGVLSDAAWHLALQQTLDHLHSALPSFFPSPPSFPPAVFSDSIALVLPPPPGLETGVTFTGRGKYSLFFAGARASLGIMLREPYVRVEGCRVLPPQQKEGFVDLPLHSSSSSGTPPLTGSSSPSDEDQPSTSPVSSAQSTRIARARLDRQVRVRVKVGGRLRLPMAGDVLGGLAPGAGGAAGADTGEREWTISNLYHLSPLTCQITTHEVESVHPLPGEGAHLWLSGQVAARAAGAGGEAGGREGGCAGAVGVEREEGGRKGEGGQTLA